VSRPRVRLERARKKTSDVWVFDGEQAHHILNVRRRSAGDIIEGLWDGRIFLLRLEMEDGNLIGVVTGEGKFVVKNDLWLLVALLKADAFERTLRMATESGAEKIVPLICERSVVRIDPEKWQVKRKRWTKIIEESTKQSGVAECPLLYEPVCIDSIPSLPLPASRYAAMLEEGSGYIVDYSPTGGAVLAIGPEGDWTSKEKERLLSEGFRAVSLGSRIMTSPTAAAVGLGCLSMKLEKFNEAKS